MPNEIFSDLTELDKRLRTVDEYLTWGSILFYDQYTENSDLPGRFSWPYFVRGRTAEPRWAKYYKVFPDTPELSVITSAMCSWAVSEYLVRAGIGEKELIDVPQDVAKNLSTLPLDKI